MRYAAALVGDLCFAAPQDAFTHGPICLSTSVYPIPGSQAEDCLFMDVYAPSSETNGSSPLLVFFWIQGGGYNSNSNPNYNGTGLIRASDMNIVVVTFNYQVGPYRFLAAEEVHKEASLNNGLKDIIKVLHWVQTNVAKFGGDPCHVVLGGDSAGAGATTLLLTAYGGDGRLGNLFHALAAESQSFAAQLMVEQSQFAYNNLTEKTSCADEKDTLACLCGLDVQILQQHNVNHPFPGANQPPLYMYSPTIDGDLVQDYTHRLLHEGHFMNVLVIFGNDTNEGTVFTLIYTSTVTQANDFLRAQFPSLNPGQLSRIDATYMATPDDPVYQDTGEYWQGVSNAYGEIRYICPGMSTSTAYASVSPSRSWNYHYAVIDTAGEDNGFGTTHMVEVNAIWGPEYVSGTPPPSYRTTNAAIVLVMQAYWTSFIRSFNPNTHRAPGSPDWNPWGKDGGRCLFIRTNDTKMETVPESQASRCTYLDSIAVDLMQH